MNNFLHFCYFKWATVHTCQFPERIGNPKSILPRPRDGLISPAFNRNAESNKQIGRGGWVLQLWAWCPLHLQPNYHHQRTTLTIFNFTFSLRSSDLRDISMALFPRDIFVISLRALGSFLVSHVIFCLSKIARALWFHQNCPKMYEIFD